MKRAILFFLVIVPVFGMLSPGPARPEKVELVCAGASVGSGNFMRFTALAEAIKRTNSNYEVTVLSGRQNIGRLDAGELDFTYTNTGSATRAAKGAKPFRKVIPLRLLASWHMSPVQLKVFSDTPITSIQDMINRKYPLKLVVGRKNTDPEFTIGELLEAYGITYEDIEAWGGKVFFASEGPGVTLMNDGMAEAHFAVGSFPSPRTTEQARTRDLKMLPITKESVLRQMENQGYVKTVLTAGVYKFMKADIPSMAMIEMVVCRPDMSGEVAYVIAKAIWEHRSYLATVYKGLEDLTPEILLGGAKAVALHPGAEKYYREMGWLK
jgi:TRAP transporter TAXI family solute receptor